MALKPSPSAVSAPSASLRLASTVTKVAKKHTDDRQAVDEKAAKRKEATLLKAAVHFMQQEYGQTVTKKKGPKLGKKEMTKLCKCHLTMGSGMHKEKCIFYPEQMRSALRAQQTLRASMAKQLKNTTLTNEQREAILDDYFGPMAPAGSAAAAASPSSSSKAPSAATS